MGNLKPSCRKDGAGAFLAFSSVFRYPLPTGFMPKHLEEITREALDLPRGQRLALAQFLLTLEDESSENAEAVWDTEIRARLKAFDEGRVETVPYEALRQNMMLRFSR